MQKVFTAILLWLGASMYIAEGMSVSHSDEIVMRDAINDMIKTSKDSNGQLFLVPGIIRFCFHDCVIICDGCIDTRRKVQGGNNGLAIVWIMLKDLYQKRFSSICSRADFFALACVVTADYAGERGEEEGTCVNPTDANGFPQIPNICRPNMQVLWGRRTCDVPQLVKPLRNIPDADQNPYEWFAENMDMTPREAVCIMGSHALGRLRKNETGFEGEYTTRFDVLSNEYFTTMVDTTTEWNQDKNFVVVDNVPQTRHQWVEPDNNLTRVNSDMFIVYDLGKLNRVGRSTCGVPPRKITRFRPHCQKSEHFPIVQEMARDNIAFIECFGDAMDKMMHTGYKPGELVPTGVEIPPPPPATKAPRASGTTTTTTLRPRPTRRRFPGRNGNRGNRANRTPRNRLLPRQPAPPGQQQPPSGQRQPPPPGQRQTPPGQRQPPRQGQQRVQRRPQPQSPPQSGIARLTQQFLGK